VTFSPVLSPDPFLPPKFGFLFRDRDAGRDLSLLFFLPPFTFLSPPAPSLENENLIDIDLPYTVKGLSCLSRHRTLERITRRHSRRIPMNLPGIFFLPLLFTITRPSSLSITISGGASALRAQMWKFLFPARAPPRCFLPPPYLSATGPPVQNWRTN